MRATVTRANRAIQMFAGYLPGMGTRKLDDCFEMGDGDAVAAIIIERLRTNSDIARAVLSGTSTFRDQGRTVEVHARRFLSPAMIAAAEAGIATRNADDRARQLIALRLASPKRANAGRGIQRQHGTDMLSLFDHAAQPCLFADAQLGMSL